MSQLKAGMTIAGGAKKLWRLGRTAHKTRVAAKAAEAAKKSSRALTPGRIAGKAAGLGFFGLLGYPIAKDLMGWGGDDEELIAEYTRQQSAQGFEAVMEDIKGQRKIAESEGERMLRQLYAGVSRPITVGERRADVLFERSAEEQLEALITSNDRARLALVAERTLPSPAEIAARAGI